MSAVAEPISTLEQGQKVVAVICSIFPNGESDKVVLQRSNRPYIVNVCPDGEEYVLTEIEPNVCWADIGDKRRQEYTFTARQVADDLCGELNRNVMGSRNSFLGYFVCKGLTPNIAELKHAKKMLTEFAVHIVAEADKQWSAKPHHDLIPTIARRFGKYLKLEKPWMYKVEVLTTCPACGERVMPEVALCKSCGFITNHDKAKELKIGPYETKPKTEA